MVNNFSKNQKIMISLVGFIATLLVIVTTIFIVKYSFYYYKSRVFFGWAKKQRLVLIGGGPASGKKMLLSYLGHQLRISKGANIVYNLITLFSDNKLSNIDDNFSNLSYSGFIDSKGKTRASFLLNELADKPAIKECSSPVVTDNHDIVAEIQRASYYNKRVWVAFAEKDGYLWNKLTARSNAIITCEKISSFSFLSLKRWYFLKLHTKFNGISTVRFVLINNIVLTNYEKYWLKASTRLNPLFNRR